MKAWLVKRLNPKVYVVAGYDTHREAIPGCRVYLSLPNAMRRFDRLKQVYGEENAMYCTRSLL